MCDIAKPTVKPSNLICWISLKIVLCASQSRQMCRLWALRPKTCGCLYERRTPSRHLVRGVKNIDGQASALAGQ